jgi:hypothetical protein
VETLDREGIEYAVGGSLASSVHGIYRSTNDIDIVIRMTPEQCGPFGTDLRDDFYVDDLSVQEAIETSSSFSVLHLATMTKADFFLLPVGAWETERWKRSYNANIPTGGDPLIVRVTSAEDMILQKLVWYRLGGYVSDRQWRDVLGMLKVKARGLDHFYLTHWAEQLGLLELLQSAIGQAETRAIP